MQAAEPRACQMGHQIVSPKVRPAIRPKRDCLCSRPAIYPALQVIQQHGGHQGSILYDAGHVEVVVLPEPTGNVFHNQDAKTEHSILSLPQNISPVTKLNWRRGENIYVCNLPKPRSHSPAGFVSRANTLLPACRHYAHAKHSFLPL